MSNEVHNWPEPVWLAQISDKEERDSERIRWMLSLACLYHSPKGTATLAAAIGMTPNALSIAKHRGKLSPENVIAVERELGRELFPREAFLPDLFTIES